MAKSRKKNPWVSMGKGMKTDNWTDSPRSPLSLLLLHKKPLQGEGAGSIPTAKVTGQQVSTELRGLKQHQAH